PLRHARFGDEDHDRSGDACGLARRIRQSSGPSVLSKRSRIGGRQVIEMDGRNPAQFKIGLFVIVGAAILVSALFLFGIRNAIEPTQKFETYITGKVEGLSIGSPVKMRGVTVGRVDEIGFS